MNNQQRRAAEQRRRERQRSDDRGSAARPPGAEHLFRRERVRDDADAAALVARQVVRAVTRIREHELDEDALVACAESLLRSVHPAPAHVVAEATGELLARLADDVTAGGWGPGDLAQLVRRHGDPHHLATLAAVLREESRRRPRSSATWLAAVQAIATPARLRLDTPSTLASGLQVAALLGVVPLLEAADLVAGAGAGAAEHPKLARVRALLAKAESTEFDEEAEALSAKAQELISHYALGRLLDQGQPGGRGSGRTDANAPQVRRIWLDPPYVRAKAALVHTVAGANRCQSALTQRLAFCVVVGAAADLDAVELLVTSLLVQANSAMLRNGRRYDAGGVARTRSFRQAFLLAYATGIGARLRAAVDEAAREMFEEGADDPRADVSARFLPVLRDHEERVAEAFTAMVPHLVSRPTSISNGEGWAAGLAAADLAQLDVNAKLRRSTG